jgi:peptidoglycan/LPS O-acetylase OafA/YrhL
MCFDLDSVDLPAKRRSLWPVLAAAGASFATASAWTAAKFASGSGYWDWPVSWWLLAVAWAVGAGLAFTAWRPRLAAPAALASLAGAVLGGFATVLVFIAIHGTGD